MIMMNRNAQRISVWFSMVPALLLTGWILGAGAVPAGLAAEQEPAKFEFRPNDHIAIIGNTLAERMQHYGWLETLLHAQYPSHNLVIRNLGYSGDEIDGWTNANHRLRSMSFGTQDEWLAGNGPCPQPNKLGERDKGRYRDNRFELTNTRADVIFAFYGYNESFAGAAGLPQFKENVEAFIRHTRGQKYNGKSAPRLVLFSPIAQELIDDPNLPGKEAVAATNARLKLYTEALREVARTNNVEFVDLFAPTEQFGARPTSPAQQPGQMRPITINGVHINDRGDRWIAAHAMDQLVRSPHPWEQGQWWNTLEPLRKSVLAKNFYWFNRYRVTDGYSTYGDRAFLRFAEGPGGYGEGLSNYTVAQRELEVLDLLTSNRDKVVWAAAKGQTIPSDDSNLPDYVPVISNKPGPLPDGKHLFLSGEESIKKMTVAENFKVELFASEEMFPELVNPVQMAFDTKGRLWVAAWQQYPHWLPTTPMNDKLLILEDTDGDGRAEVCKTFAGDLTNPTGFEFYNGGVLVSQGPDILFLKDTNGDDRYDIKERVLHGLDTADTHHTANSFTLDPGGALYFQEGTFHHTQVETAWGPPQRVANGAVFRYEPRAQKFDVYVSTGFANPHGHAFDRWGQDIVVDGTGANPYHAALFSGYVEFPAKHPKPPQVYQQRTRPCAGIEFLSSRHYPEANQGNLLVTNVIGFQGILQYKIADAGSSFAGTEIEPIVQSSDPNFRPTDLEIGPDGAIYFTDWQNPIIGHMQHNLRDPSRDRVHGRVYRVTYPGRPLLKPAKIAGEPIEKLLDLLKEPEDRVRYRAKTELSSRDAGTVLSALAKWRTALDKNDPQYEHHRLEALWMHQYINIVNVEFLNEVLGSPDFRARSAAARVLCYWRDRVPGTFELLKKLADDEHPRVRLEAVRAASFFTAPEAIEVALISLEKPGDPYLDFCRNETMKTLEPYWKKTLSEGKKLNLTSNAGMRFLLKNLSTDELLKMERTKGVFLELLFRRGVRDEYRNEALAGLSRLESKQEIAVLLEAIRNQDAQETGDESVAFDLIRLLTGRRGAALTGARDDLQQMALAAKQPVTRQLGFVALVTADGSVENAWSAATKSVQALRDLVAAMPMIPDASLRAALYPKVAPLLDGLPQNLSPGGTNVRGTQGRFVRIELEGRKTLTLAEVEVYSDGRNIARQGRASQKNTAHGGDAQRAIDGNKDGSYGKGGQTHTEENTRNPYWEVDLGAEYPLDSVVVYNRTEGDLGKRLEGFTLKVLDNRRNEVFSRKNNPAPKPSLTITLEGGGPESVIRRAAMLALTSVRGEEAPTFQALAAFVRNNTERHAAVQALQRIPTRFWPAEAAAPLLTTLTDDIRKLPAADRTTPAAMDAIQLAYSLTTLLPAAEAKAARRELGELSVQIIRIGTVTDQMLFDKERLAVQAGKPVEFVFENTDIMPHNFVITEPGALEEIGLLAEASATHPGALERHYVPASKRILLSSRLLQPRQSENIPFVAPKQPGIYPYVCTYPGHWRRMYGALYVVENLEDYLADPEAYLAAHPLPIADELLKFNRPRKEWKLEELAGAVEALESGRSFGNAKQIFMVANCVACQRLNGAGNEIGPDLSKLDPKYTQMDVLKEILDPSAKINEKFQTWAFETESGKAVTGLVVEETPQLVKVIENPLAKAEPTVLKKSEIVARQKSPTSIMPKGLFDKLTREEILDLVAYVTARGDQKHKLFHGAHDHKHQH
jgi:putative heme-binding domain-containing protein